MKLIIAAAMSFALVVSPVLAVTPVECASGTPLTTSELTTLINSFPEVSGSDHGETWQEVHQSSGSGMVFDCKMGRTSQGYTGPDPKVQVATYTIAQFGTGKGRPGAITYTYINGGGVFGYTVVPMTGTIKGSHGSYAFCTTSGGLSFPVTVDASTCGSGSSPS